MKYKNTINKGSVRCIIFKEGDTWYGVALELNLIEEGQDPLEVKASLYQAIKGYVETARKFKMRPMSLNQKPDKEYENLWNALQDIVSSKDTKKNRDVIGQKQVFDFGYHTGAFSTALGC
ncbi:MAG: hypothetical protein HQ539_02985 [Parcubacteria group bacterium]|nr:hypothetical protein [Parcubacteria group bacterium]